MTTENEAVGNIIPGEAEQQAKAQGWAPKEDWKGPEDKWVDAETFLKRGENITGVLKERNGYLTRELREVRQLLVEQKDMAQRARIQGYQQALEDIARRQREAAASADVDAYDAAERDRQRVVKNFTEDQRRPENVVDHEFEEWKDENPWFDADEDMQAYACAISTAIQKKEGLGGRKLYEAVGKRVKQNFPHKFSNPRRSEAGAVEAGAQPPAPKKSGRTFDDLPETAKSTYAKMARQFKQQGSEFKKEEYLANYIWD